VQTLGEGLGAVQIRMLEALGTAATWNLSGADDGIRTRDPHLGKKEAQLRSRAVDPARGILGSARTPACAVGHAMGSAPLARGSTER